VKILLLHNRYQIAGGEDTTVAAEKSLLESHGHMVVFHEVSNIEIAGAWSRAKVAGQVIYNRAARRRVADELARHRPDIVHVHNFFPLLSPSVYYACRAAGVPVVQTLHNYRLLCSNALFFRDGRPCEDCLGKTVPWPGVWHGCYRQSRAATVPVVAMLTAHRAFGTWRKAVDRYIVMTEFAREKFIAGGLPADRIVVKPHFVDPAPAPGEGRGGYALYAGRLSQEKGVQTLLSAWKQIGSTLPLKIVGDGPLATAQGGGEWLGRRSREEVFELMREAAVLIFPSICYETFGIAIAEAFAAGTPVIASRLGSMASLVEHGRTGLHFEAGNADDLAKQVRWFLEHPVEAQQMRRAARAEFEAKYTAERNYRMLMEIYQAAIQRRKCC
jgi:glycosyltransferase involved in cell wall biosynthesis